MLVKWPALINNWTFSWYDASIYLQPQPPLLPSPLTFPLLYNHRREAFMLLFWESCLQPCFLIWGLSHCVGSWWSVELATMWNCRILTTPSSLGVAGHVTWTQPVRPSCPGLILWGWGVSQQPEACVAGVSSGGVASVPQEVVLKEVTQLPVSWSPRTALVSVLFQAVLQLSLHDEFPNILPEHSYFWDRSS